MIGAVGALLIASCATLSADDRDALTPQQDSAKYPCDVFSYAFCFRKPYGAVVLQRSGPDFEIYQVQGGDSRPFFSLYVGTTPERESDDAVRLRNFKVRGIDVTVNLYLDAEGNDAVELRLSYPTGLKVHVFDARDAVARTALAEVLSGFRACSKLDFTSIECEVAPLFDSDVASVIQQRD
ncbi:hypothetical protein [Luteimonas sp. R10]|uniref:hypothetical protein n=1 Tax=Luteimonas sp. R10 TaxID=3108176 RepID=UPI00309187DC|nr:hypothetical protein U3649_15165 [Luteimonas sp. R10]